MPTDPRLERAREGGADRQTLDDLGAIFDDFGEVLKPLDDLGNFATSHTPAVLAKLDALEQHGFGSHVPRRHAHHLENMLHRFHAILERNMHLERELAHINQSSNVILSTPLDNVPALSTSTLVTFGAPYSGVKFMICACLVPAEITPPGRFSSLNFMGIDFATPSTSPANVTYLNNTPGVGGTPLQLGMGLASLYTNLTAPRGPRVFEPWTGWLFDPAAKISFAVYNPSGAFPGSYLIDWLMRSTPCPQGHSFADNMAIGHVGYHDMGGLVDAIHHFAIGIGETNTRAALRPHALASSGYQLLAGGGGAGWRPAR